LNAAGWLREQDQQSFEIALQSGELDIEGPAEIRYSWYLGETQVNDTKTRGPGGEFKISATDICARARLGGEVKARLGKTSPALFLTAAALLVRGSIGLTGADLDATMFKPSIGFGFRLMGHTYEAGLVGYILGVAGGFSLESGDIYLRAALGAGGGVYLRRNDY
jgi:hypothetical protein